MKNAPVWLLTILVATACSNQKTSKETTAETAPRRLFLDVHNLGPGKVTFAAVADAHKKDLATEGKYNVNFIKYWVDEKLGKVYCLAEASDSSSIANTHKEAHGLLPDFISPVTDGPEVQIKDPKSLYFDVHHLGAGKVTAAAVADAHTKDLAAQNEFKVNFINYWVDEKDGIVVCLSESPDSAAIARTHGKAHGLLPDEVHKVDQGQ